MKLWQLFAWCLCTQITSVFTGTKLHIQPISTQPQPSKESNNSTAKTTESISNHYLKRHSRSLGSFRHPDSKELNDDAAEKMALLSNSQALPQEKSVYVIPYMRPGRSSSDDYDRKKRDDGDMIPVLRFGRSDDNLIPNLRIGKSAQERYYGASVVLDDGVHESEFQNNGNMALIPSLRLGRNDRTGSAPASNESLIPQIRYGRDTEQRLNLLPYPRLGRANYGSSGEMAPSVEEFGKRQEPSKFRQEAKAVILLLGDGERQKLDDGSKSPASFVIPYPRPGKRYLSQLSALKQAKINRHQTGASGLAEQSASDYVLPYPRPGKRSEYSVNDSGYMLPVLRMGRSDFTGAYQSTGTSYTVIPNMRPGRSNSVIPIMRPGRSSSVIPNIRPGRSGSVIPNIRPGRSGSVIPNIRPGRSSSVIPNIRPGRSTSVIPNMRPGRSSSADYIVPSLRLGKAVPAMDELDFQEFHDDDDSNSQESSAELDSNFFVSSLGIDSNQIIATQPEINREIKVISPSFPNPAKKLNKHNPTDESVYLLPYLRPGRSV